jgi:hypothetical protein
VVLLELLCKYSSETLQLVLKDIVGNDCSSRREGSCGAAVKFGLLIDQTKDETK